VKRPPKRGGRPAIDPDHPAVSVTCRLDLKTYNLLYKQATAARCSVAEQLRRVITRRVYLQS
jgi:hypothetical protein